MPEISKSDGKAQTARLLRAINATWYGGVLNTRRSKTPLKCMRDELFADLKITQDGEDAKLIADRITLAEEQENSSHEQAVRLRYEVTEGAALVVCAAVGGCENNHSFQIVTVPPQKNAQIDECSE
jgi:hypothetical protein